MMEQQDAQEQLFYSFRLEDHVPGDHLPWQIIVDVETTPAGLSQGIVSTRAMLERVNKRHALTPEKLAADKDYETDPFLGWLSQRSIVPHIPVLDRQHQIDGLLPCEVFTFDPEKNTYTCPENKVLKSPPAPATSQVQRFYAKERDCRACPIRQQCTRGRFRCLSVSVDEAIRQQTKDVQNTKPFQHSRRLRKKVEMLRSHEAAVSVYKAEASRVEWRL